MVDYVFPLQRRPSLDYQSGGRSFGSRRSGGKRKHAGCDLIMKAGTPIVAMANGVVTKGPYYFYSNTYALEVTCDKDHRVIRYGEIKKQLPAGVHAGAKVKQGQVIAYVGRLKSGRSMLHLEMYEGATKGRLTQSGVNRYMRRRDVTDPTPFLLGAPLVSEVSAGLSAEARKQAPKPREKVMGKLTSAVETGLKVRNEPSLSDSKVLTTLPRDARVEIVPPPVRGKEPHPFGDRSTWYKIRYRPKGQTMPVEGYVVAHFVEPEGELEEDGELPESGREGIISPDRAPNGLRVRAAPRRTAAFLTKLKAGRRISVLDPEVDGDVYDGWDRNDWVKIQVEINEKPRTAFAAGYYVDLISVPDSELKKDSDGDEIADVKSSETDQDEWTSALLQAPSTGASAKTARQVGGGLSGKAASEAMAQEDLERVKQHAERFVSAANKTALPAALLAAVASRESRCGNALDSRGWGDRGNAFGVMQIDKRHHEILGLPDPFSSDHIEQAATYLNDNLTRLSKNFPAWEPGYQLKGAVAAYNFGVGNVRTKGGIDGGTTGDDYGSDVIARARYYLKHSDLAIFRV